MTIKRISKIQPPNFEFTEINMIEAQKEITKYPKDKKSSAVIALLYLVQKQNDNWIPISGIQYVSQLLEIPYIQVYEVCTFYSMFNLSPVGKYFVQVCTTTPCMIRGAQKIVDVCKNNISKNQNELSENKLCSWVEVECLGACVNAPMIQVNDDYYEDLTAESVVQLLKDLKDGKKVSVGSQTGRKGSMALSGPTTLEDQAKKSGVA